MTVLPRKYVSESGRELILKNPYSTDINFIFKDVKEFKFDTIEGKIFITRTKVVIPQIYNHVKHNGAFEDLMYVLMNIAHDLQRDLWFINFMNKDLKKHLIKMWGFKSKVYESKRFDGVYYKWENTYLIQE